MRASQVTASKYLGQKTNNFLSVIVQSSEWPWDYSEPFYSAMERAQQSALSSSATGSETIHLGIW